MVSDSKRDCGKECKYHSGWSQPVYLPRGNHLYCWWCSQLTVLRGFKMAENCTSESTALKPQSFVILGGSARPHKATISVMRPAVACSGMRPEPGETRSEPNMGAGGSDRSPNAHCEAHTRSKCALYKHSAVLFCKLLSALTL